MTSRLLEWGLLGAALLLLLAFADVPERTMGWTAIFDAGHVPLFGLLAIAVLRFVRVHLPGASDRRASVVTLGVVAVIGVLTELLQNFQPNREPSFGDFARDLAGAGAFLLAEHAGPRPSGLRRPRGRQRRSALILTAAAMLVAVANVQLAKTAGILVARRAAMPTLFALDGSWWERDRVEAAESSRLTPRGDPATTPAGASEPLARLDMKPGEYPGVALREPYPDWRGYRRLAFTVLSDLQAPVRLEIRVDDALHDQRHDDRFNRSLNIAPGVNRIEIPLDDIRNAPRSREIDLSRMRGIILFAYRPRAPFHLFLGPLRLE